MNMPNVHRRVMAEMKSVATVEEDKSTMLTVAFAECKQTQTNGLSILCWLERFRRLVEVEIEKWLTQIFFKLE
jgi:hypothetical protein